MALAIRVKIAPRATPNKNSTGSESRKARVRAKVLAAASSTAMTVRFIFVVGLS